MRMSWMVWGRRLSCEIAIRPQRGVSEWLGADVRTVMMDSRVAVSHRGEREVCPGGCRAGRVGGGWGRGGGAGASERRMRERIALWKDCAEVFQDAEGV